MRIIIVWLDKIINKHKMLKRWKRIVTVLVAIITFATTYALILPHNIEYFMRLNAGRLSVI